MKKLKKKKNTIFNILVVISWNIQENLETILKKIVLKVWNDFLKNYREIKRENFRIDFEKLYDLGKIGNIFVNSEILDKKKIKNIFEKILKRICEIWSRKI